MASQPVSLDTSIGGNSYWATRKGPAAGLGGHFSINAFHFSVIYIFYLTLMETPKPKLKKPIIIIILSLLLVCCSCFVIMWVLGANSTTEINSLNSNTDNWVAENPTELLKFNCNFVSNLSINNTTLTTSQLNDACNKDKGYPVQLKDGTNMVEVTASNMNQNSHKNLNLVITFDLKKYQENVAKVEEQKNQQALAEAEKLKQEQLAQQQKVAEEKAKKEAEANKPKVGDSLLGPSFKQIKDEYNTQKDLSSYKGDEYLKSLQGVQIQWIAEVSDVREEWLGDDLYVSLNLSGGIFSDHAYIYNPSKELLALNKGQTIKVKATIKEVYDMFGVSVALKNATFEIIN